MEGHRNEAKARDPTSCGGFEAFPAFDSDHASQKALCRFWVTYLDLFNVLELAEVFEEILEPLNGLGIEQRVVNLSTDLRDFAGITRSIGQEL